MNPSTGSGRPFDRLRTTLRQAQGERVRSQPLMVSLSNHHGELVEPCYSRASASSDFFAASSSAALGSATCVTALVTASEANVRASAQPATDGLVVPVGIMARATLNRGVLAM